MGYNGWSTNAHQLDAEHHHESVAVGIMTGRSHWNDRDLAKLGFKLAKSCMTIKEPPLRQVTLVVVL